MYLMHRDLIKLQKSIPYRASYPHHDLYHYIINDILYQYDHHFEKQITLPLIGTSLSPYIMESTMIVTNFNDG